jgi:hypothetical protein
MNSGMNLGIQAFRRSNYIQAQPCAVLDSGQLNAAHFIFKPSLNKPRKAQNAN